MKYQLLSQLLMQQLGEAVQQEQAAGIQPIPTDTDETLLKIAQLPHDKVRSLICFAVVDHKDEVKGPGIDVQTFVLGSVPSINALMPIVNLQVGHMVAHPDEPLPDGSDSGGPCPDCGGDHGLSEEFDRAGIPPHSEMGGLIMLASALARRRRGGRLF